VSLDNNEENETDKKEYFVGLLFIYLLFNVGLMFSTIYSLLHFHALGISACFDSRFIGQSWKFMEGGQLSDIVCC
jgi:hypothetical protein